MSKHTQGEWWVQVVENEGVNPLYLVCCESFAPPIAHVDYHDERPAAAKADAHLIAAAPDMLELLESLHSQSTITEGIRIAAVIDKAKGGAHE